MPLHGLSQNEGPPGMRVSFFVFVFLLEQLLLTPFNSWGSFLLEEKWAKDVGCRRLNLDRAFQAVAKPRNLRVKTPKALGTRWLSAPLKVNNF